MQTEPDQAVFNEVTEGVWVSSDPVRILGTHLTATMTVLRLASGKLLVHSPVAMTTERRSGVEQLGEVAHIYAPNLFHHLWTADWTAAFSEARLHAPHGLSKKRPELEIHRHHGADSDSDWSTSVEEIPIQGFRLRESALFHRSSGTLVVADLVHNVGRPSGSWTKTYTTSMGFYDTVALSRALRWTAFSDRTAARRSIDRVLALPFERIVVGHGTPITTAAKEQLTEAFRWLK